MPIGLVGLLCATVFCLGLAALFRRATGAGRALALGLMGQAAVLYLMGVARHLGLTEGHLLGVLALGLLPLTALPWRERRGRGQATSPAQPEGSEEEPE